MKHYTSDTFDLVHCRQVLHHARNLRQLCRELARVLKPNGLMIATREHVVTSRRDLEPFLKRHVLHRLYGGENAYPLEEYVAAITEAGIRLAKALNHYESDINLFPESITSTKARIARRFLLPWPTLIPDGLLSWRGRHMNTPGRLYTFVGRKNI